MYTNYAYGVQNQTGTPSANYNLFVTGTNDYTGSTGFMIKNDTTLSGPNKKGTRIFQDNTDNAYLDFRTTATDGAKSFAFRLQDDASPSTFNNMLTLNKDTVADTSVYGASISGRVKASQFYVNQPDNRAPNTAGVYMGQNNSTTGYFNINKGTGSGGFNFQTFNADGVTNKTNLSLNGSGSVQIPYYSTVTTDSQDSETTAMAVFDSTGNLVRSYKQNQRFRSVETRLNNLEGTVVASVPVKVNEIIGRLNTLKIWNTQIAGLNISAPPAPFNPSPATTAAAVQVQLALSVSLTTAQDPAWQTSFINAVATNLGISPSRIVISSVSLTATVYSASYKHLTLQKAYTAAAAGSVYVNVVVNPDPAGTSSVTPTIAASIIIAKAQNPSSDLAAAVAATGAVVDTGYVPAQKPSATATPAPTISGDSTYYDITSGVPTTITLNAASNLEIFMIGGGGGGGGSHGGGGGAGAYYYTNGTPISLPTGTVLNVNVGTGGRGGTTTVTSSRGGDTVIQKDGVEWKRVSGGGGGGGGLDGVGVANKSGGCGGGGQSAQAVNMDYGNIAGGTVTGLTGETGFAGGIGYAAFSQNYLTGGGGGGITSIGKDYTNQKRPDGGSGLAITWNGVQIGFGGGGGGGVWDEKVGHVPGIGGSATVNGSSVVLGGTASIGTQANQFNPGANALANTGSGGGGGGSYSCPGGLGSGGRCLIKITSTVSPTPTQQPRTFNPLSIPGMLVWLDANDLTTFSPANITNNTDITQWRDKSGNQNHCTPTIYVNSPAMSNPKYNETGQSGNKSVYLNRSKLVGTLSTAYKGQSLIVYVVMKQTDPGPSAVGRLMSFGVSGETDYQNLAYTGFTSAGVGSSYGYGSLRGWSPISRNAYVTSPNCLNVSTIATLIDNPNEHTIQINGGTSTNSAAAGGLPNNFNIVNYTVGGHTYPDDALMSGYLSEVLVFGGILSTDQKQQIEGYLANKWDLQSSLASNHPYKSSLPQMTTFSPISIPGCSLWLDASTLPTGTITTWNDMSGFGNHAGVKQGTNTVVASGLNSLKAVQFSGSNSMNGTFTANSTNVANCMTSFVVATGSKSGMTGTFGRIMSLHPASDATDWLPAATIPFFYVHTTGKLCVHHNSTEIGVDWTTDTPFIAQSSETYGTLSIGINGQLTPTTTANPGSTLNLNAYCIGGANFDNLSNWTGKIMEVIYYNVLLTTAQIQQVEGYLAWKWGLVSNLPSAHPYKLSAPFSNYFSIKQLPNPLVWLDAQDASTLTLSGSNVTGWADKSGNGANASVVSAGSAVPTITANAIGTKNAVTFYNTSQYVSPTFMAAPYGTAYTGSSLQVFVVGMDKGSAEYGRILSSYDNASYRDNSPTGIASLGLAGASGSGLTTYRNNYSPSTVQAMTTNTAFIAQSYQLPGTNGNSINGSFSPSVSAAGTTLFSPLNIIGSGIGAGGGRGWNGYIGEVMVFGSAFTPQQITMIEGYLANKWSLASLLPTVHPYKSITPVAPQTLMGRKITFAALPTSTTSIASDGIEVYSYPGGPNIINSGLTVTSSPSYNSTFTPDRWINNNNSGNEWIGYNTTGQYIQVDLGAMIPIYKIVLYNRAFCCGQGNNGAKIQICTDDGSVSYISNPLSDTSGSTTPSGGSTTFGSWTFYPPNKNWIGNA